MSDHVLVEAASATRKEVVGKLKSTVEGAVVLVPQMVLGCRIHSGSFHN